MSTQPILGVTKHLRFPGMGATDTPFAVMKGITAVEVKEESAELIGAVRATLKGLIASGHDSNSDILSGCVFMLDAASALVESLGTSEERSIA